MTGWGQDQNICRLCGLHSFLYWKKAVSPPFSGILPADLVVDCHAKSRNVRSHHLKATASQNSQCCLTPGYKKSYTRRSVLHAIVNHNMHRHVFKFLSVYTHTGKPKPNSCLVARVHTVRSFHEHHEELCVNSYMEVSCM